MRAMLCSGVGLVGEGVESGGWAGFWLDPNRVVSADAEMPYAVPSLDSGLPSVHMLAAFIARRSPS